METNSNEVKWDEYQNQVRFYLIMHEVSFSWYSGAGTTYIRLFWYVLFDILTSNFQENPVLVRSTAIYSAVSKRVTQNCQFFHNILIIKYASNMNTQSFSCDFLLALKFSCLFPATVVIVTVLACLDIRSLIFGRRYRWDTRS